jgi:hypothetical protein
VSFVWSTEQEITFRKLKEKLVSKPILQYPDFTKEFILVATDVNNEGLGAILSQAEIEKDLPIVYACQNLKRTIPQVFL